MTYLHFMVVGWLGLLGILWFKWEQASEACLFTLSTKWRLVPREPETAWRFYTRLSKAAGAVGGAVVFLYIIVVALLQKLEGFNSMVAIVLLELLFPAMVALSMACVLALLCRAAYLYIRHPESAVRLTEGRVLLTPNPPVQRDAASGRAADRQR